VSSVVVTAYHKKMIIIAGLILLTLAVYWNVQNFGFVNFDDNIYVTKNPQVQDGLSCQGIIEIFSDVSTGNWHPLTMISHMLDWELFGKNAGGHHWSSLIIHIINTVLLFLLLNQMTGSIWRSALVAALFAIHPINVESVAWVSERKNVLSTFFWFLTMMFYVWYVKQPHWKRYLPVFICFALGLMSKSMLVTLPFVLLLMDYWPLNRTMIDTQNKLEMQPPSISVKAKLSFLILEKIPLFALTAIFIAVTLHTQLKEKAIASLDYIPLSLRIYNAILSYFIYLKKIFWPTDLAVFYPLVDIRLQQILPAAAFLIAATTICCKYHKKCPYLGVGWFWYLGTLVPVIGLVQVGSQAMADRYAYVPIIGIFLMITWGIVDIFKSRLLKPVAALISFIILSTLGYCAHNQVQYWQNEYTLYTHAIKTVKPNVLLYKNLGLEMIEQHKPEAAVALFRKAIELRPDPELYSSLGLALHMMGKYVEAEEQYIKALSLNPEAYLAHNNLGMLYMQKAKDDEALKHFQDAVRLQPRFANAHYRLAVIFKRKGMNEKANYHYQEAIRINPEFGKMDF